MPRKNSPELEAEMRVAQDYRRFLSEAEQLLQSAKQLSGDSANLMRQKLEARVAQAKVSLEAARSTAAQRYQSSSNKNASSKLLWAAGLFVTGAALAAYVYKRKS
jgi:ElaB/YqjD/DUF883 family membrane-anchored ribosome-binding protein